MDGNNLGPSEPIDSKIFTNLLTLILENSLYHLLDSFTFLLESNMTSKASFPACCESNSFGGWFESLNASLGKTVEFLTEQGDLKRICNIAVENN